MSKKTLVNIGAIGVVLLGMIFFVAAVVVGFDDLSRYVFSSGTLPTSRPSMSPCDPVYLSMMCSIDLKPPTPIVIPECPACPDLTCPSVVEIHYPDESEVRIAIEYIDRYLTRSEAFYCSEYLRTGDICNVIEARFHLLRALGEIVPPATLP